MNLNSNFTTEYSNPIGDPHTVHIGPAVSGIYSAVLFSDNLVNISVDSGNPYYAAVDNILLNHAEDRIIVYPHGRTDTSYTVDASIRYISERAFCDEDNLVSVVVAGDIVEIGEEAFANCSNLENIHFQGNAENIGHEAFSYCTSLEQITWDGDVIAIGSYAFSNCVSLTSLTTPASLSSISERAFYECSALTDIVINGNDLDIAEYAFYSFSGTRNITINCNIVTQNNSAFDFGADTEHLWINADVTGGSELSSRAGVYQTIHVGRDVSILPFSAIERYYVDPESTHFSTSDDGILFNKDKTVLVDVPFLYPSTEYTIPDTVLTIKDGSFHLDILEVLTIPSSVAYIENNAIAGSDRLHTINIDADVPGRSNNIMDCEALTTINLGPNANSLFSVETWDSREELHKVWKQVEEINVDTGNTSYSSVDGIVFSKDGTELIYFPAGTETTSYEIPSFVTTVGKSAFSYDPHLSEITFPQSVTTIRNEAFAFCAQLSSVYLPESISEMGMWVFSFCDNLLEIDVEASSRPAGWDSNWNLLCDAAVNWGVAAP